MSENILFIIDWDDTLLSSSFLEKKKREEKLESILKMKYNKELKKLSEKIINLIVKLKRIGEVIIITSSRDNWVKHSSKLYLSEECQKIIETIKIYYVDEILNEMKKYNEIMIREKKAIVFENIINKYILIYELEKKSKTIYEEILNPLKKREMNIISLGDGEQEEVAYYYMTEKSNINKYIKLNYKHVCFKRYPDINELLEELELVKNLIPLIISKEKKYNYKLEIINGRCKLIENKLIIDFVYF
jgi:hypothetical protein